MFRLFISILFHSLLVIFKTLNELYDELSVQSAVLNPSQPTLSDG